MHNRSLGCPEQEALTATNNGRPKRPALHNKPHFKATETDISSSTMESPIKANHDTGLSV